MKSLETRTLESLKKYVMNTGFLFENQWYFRDSWMNKDLLALLKDAHVVELEGNVGQIREKGINPFEYDKRYDSSVAGSAKVWKITSKEVNDYVGQTTERSARRETEYTVVIGTKIRENHISSYVIGTTIPLDHPDYRETIEAMRILAERRASKSDVLNVKIKL